MIRTLLVIGALCFAPGLFAQNAVVITQQNAKFNAPGDELNWGFLDGTALQMPTRGENQVWDYSQTGIAVGGYTAEYIEPDNADFPTATASYNAYYALNQFQLSGKAFFEARETGEYYIGNAYDEVTFDLGIGTLTVPEQTNHMSGATDIQLPATYGTNWVGEENLPLNSNVTVAAAGLDNAPLLYLQLNTYYDSIVGYGTLKMPGGGSYDALLKKRVWIQTDSFFLYGQPAPEALLTLFGVQQGATTTGEYYSFFAPGVSTELMSFSEFEGAVSASYRNDLSTNSVGEEAAGVATRLYPNPVTGESAVLEFEKSSGASWNVRLVNPLGETVRTIPVNGPAGQTRMQVGPDASAPNGVYYYELRDEQGARRAAGPVVIERK